MAGHRGHVCAGRHSRKPFSHPPEFRPARTASCPRRACRVTGNDREPPGDGTHLLRHPVRAISRLDRRNGRPGTHSRLRNGLCPGRRQPSRRHNAEDVHHPLGYRAGVSGRPGWEVRFVGGMGMSGNETDVEPGLAQPPPEGLVDEPTVSVIVATRNRPRDLARFLKSAKELDDVGFEIVIADQSDGDESELLCGGSPLASRIRYLRCLPRGKSNAVNHAARFARAPILALTDDDCTPDSLWLRNAVDAFAERPYLSVLFGEFVPIEHDPGREFVPSYRITNPQEYRTVPSASWQSGLGGNMVVRKAAFMAVGGLDECLGPGARFRNADDFDLNHRLVSAGYIA